MTRLSCLHPAQCTRNHRDSTGGKVEVWRPHTVTHKERRGKGEKGRDNNERLRGGEGEQGGRAPLINQKNMQLPFVLGWTQAELL